MNIEPSLRLQCRHCGWRLDNDVQMEAVKLHFEVEHESNDVQRDLVSVCTCLAKMDGNGIESHRTYQVHLFVCPSCGNRTKVRQDRVTPGDLFGPRK